MSNIAPFCDEGAKSIVLTIFIDYYIKSNRDSSLDKYSQNSKYDLKEKSYLKFQYCMNSTPANMSLESLLNDLVEGSNLDVDQLYETDKPAAEQVNPLPTTNECQINTNIALGRKRARNHPEILRGPAVKNENKIVQFPRLDKNPPPESFPFPDEKNVKTYVKTWAITYAHIEKMNISPLMVLDELKKKHGLVEYIIAKEDYNETEGEHLHCYIKTDKRIHWKKDMFDVCGLHGNYQKVQSVKKWINYCVKGGNYVSNIDVKSYNDKKGKLTLEDFEKDPLELVEEGLLEPLQLATFVKNKYVYQMMKANKANSNAQMDLVKKRHIWVYGKTNTGKTTMLEKFKKAHPNDVFQVAYNKDFQGYCNEKYLYLDEFIGQFSIQELNNMCQGGVKLNAKFGGVILRPDVVVYINSNLSINDIYLVKDKSGGINPDLDKQVAALHTRFNQIRLTKEFKPEPIDIRKEMPDLEIPEGAIFE